LRNLSHTVKGAPNEEVPFVYFGTGLIATVFGKRKSVKKTGYGNQFSVFSSVLYFLNQYLEKFNSKYFSVVGDRDRYTIYRSIPNGRNVPETIKKYKLRYESEPDKHGQKIFIFKKGGALGESLYESGETNIPVEYDPSNDEVNFSAEFKIGKNVYFANINRKYLSFGISKKDGITAARKEMFDLTNAKHASFVITTIKKIFKKYLDEYNPEALYFHDVNKKIKSYKKLIFDTVFKNYELTRNTYTNAYKLSKKG
jgi:hypothetical protein